MAWIGHRYQLNQSTTLSTERQRKRNRKSQSITERDERGHQKINKTIESCHLSTNAVKVSFYFFQNTEEPVQVLQATNGVAMSV